MTAWNGDFETNTWDDLAISGYPVDVVVVENWSRRAIPKRRCRLRIGADDDCERVFECECNP